MKDFLAKLIRILRVRTAETLSTVLTIDSAMFAIAPFAYGHAEADMRAARHLGSPSSRRFHARGMDGDQAQIEPLEGSVPVS
jgi:hypothetical protein